MESKNEKIAIDSPMVLTKEVDSTYPEEINTLPDTRVIEIGAVLPDLEDSTLLTFIYDSCYLMSNGFAFNNGPQYWTDDSVYMQVNAVFGSDTHKIIYIVGEVAIAETMHNLFKVTTLAVCKVKNGWKITDVIVDEEWIDFESADLVGEYFNRILVKTHINGVYAGGVMYEESTYTLLEKGKLDGLSVSFMTGSSNTASSQCFAETDDPDFHCDCYDRSGKDSVWFDNRLNALVFDYVYQSTDGDCDMKNAVESKTTQRWYMNADTCFMANGNYLSEWGERIEDEVKMTEEEIKKILKMK